MVPENYIVLERVDYGMLSGEESTATLLNFITMQIAPSRINLLADLASTALAIYVNDWIMAAWFLTAMPINILYFTFYMLDPVADMPPIYIFE